jgi:hypothetical protein
MAADLHFRFLCWKLPVGQGAYALYSCALIAVGEARENSG